MRKGRYVTKNELQHIDLISKVSYAIDPKNIVTISWAWPRNGGIKLAAVFATDNADDSLDTLLTSRPEPVIVTKDIAKPYSKPLDADECVYKIYPAYFGEGSDIIILNQLEDNVTGRVLRVVTVNYKIEYKAIPLSEFQRVSLSLRASDKLPSVSALSYAKFRSNARICAYPLGSEREQHYEFYIKKHETIMLCVSEEFTGSVLLREERADEVGRK